MSFISIFYLIVWSIFVMFYCQMKLIVSIVLPLQSYSGTNVYGILRALRSSSTESIVISAPYRPPTSIHPTNAPAIALMLALADFFASAFLLLIIINVLLLFINQCPRYIAHASARWLLC